MVQNFVGINFPKSVQDAEMAKVPEIIPERDRVRFLLIGSAEGVARIIHELHCLDFAEVNEWSKPLPTGEQVKIMRVMTKNILL